MSSDGSSRQGRAWTSNRVRADFPILRRPSMESRSCYWITRRPRKSHRRSSIAWFGTTGGEREYSSWRAHPRPIRAAHRIPFPIVADRGGVVAARLGATAHPVGGRARRAGARSATGGGSTTSTPSARGAPSPGAATSPGRLEALLAGRPIDVPETEAIGCPIDAPATGPAERETAVRRPLTLTAATSPRSSGGVAWRATARGRSPRSR